MTTMNKRLLALCAAVFAGIVPAAAHAAHHADRAHTRLWDTIRAVGVDTAINHPGLCDDGTAGMYSSSYGAMVVCQDNRVKPLQAVRWTENDYDTLRHEAHHIIQDCVDGKRGDGNLETLFEGRELGKFVFDAGIGKQQLESIIGVYAGDKGLDDDDVLVEIEAFAVANSIPADTIADTMLRVCK